MPITAKTPGGLACRIYDELPAGVAPRLGVVFCHGFGAPGTDLVPLGPTLLRRNPVLAAEVQFVFPEAPLSMEAMGLPEGRAWWMLDVERLAASVERGEFRNQREELPDGLESSRELLRGLLEAWQAESGLSVERIVLGGFSQGAMLATDVALRLDARPAGLCIFSGTLLCESVWRELTSRRGPLPVFQSHGRQDPLLPFQAAVWLRDLLTEAGLPVEFLPFEGMHTIPESAVARTAEFLAKPAAKT